MGAQENHSSYDKFNKLNLAGIYQKISRPIIVSDRLRTPENMGSVLRLAGNIGAEKTIFLSDVAQDFRLRRIKKTASTANENTPWEIRDENQLSTFIPAGFQIVAIETSEKAESIFDFQFPEKTAFIVGSERYGIRPEILKQAHHQVYIPIPGPVSSLNVTHALSVALFEWLRQMI
ncbi:MAG: TrmH family RNA methyltransferase [Bacteroidales bacterium]|nr:TrmH family RNA methyltransferase [Bacteroidales bacterium]